MSASESSAVAFPLKVSVVMPAYNHARYIRQAVESVLAQEADFPWELILADDASTDGTGEIAAEYGRRYPERVRVLRHPRNLGLLRNVERVLKASRGAYIIKLEADDYWTDPGKLRRQARFLDTHPDVAICYTNAVSFVEGAEGTPEVMIRPGERRPSIGLDELVRGNQILTLTAMFRNRASWDLPLEFFRATQADWPLFCWLAREGRVAYLETVTAAYRKHPGGVFSRRTDTEKVYKSARTQELIDRMLAYRYHEIIRPELIRKYRTVIRWGWSSREYRYLLLGAVRLWRIRWGRPQAGKP